MFMWAKVGSGVMSCGRLGELGRVRALSGEFSLGKAR